MLVRIPRPDGGYNVIQVGAAPRERRGGGGRQDTKPVIYVPPLPTPAACDVQC